MGFNRAFQGLLAENRIEGLQLIEVQVYGAAAARIDPSHAADRAQVVLFRATSGHEDFTCSTPRLPV